MAKIRACIVALHAAMLSILLAVSPAGSGSMLLMGAGGGSVANPLTLDGVANGSGGTTTQTLTLTTTKTNNVIILMVEVNDFVVSTVTSSGLTWTKRASKFSGGITTVEEWWAPAASILTSNVITITYTGSASFSIATAFAVNGGKLSSPFDPNASLPRTSTTLGVTFDTTNAITMVIACAADSSGAVPSGYTGIHNEAFWVVAYKLFSSPQTGISVPWANGTNIADALVVGP